MADINDGGPAFPRLERAPEMEGMSLRDYFAAKALQGFCASSSITVEEAGDVPNVCYQLADEMLKAREVRNG